METDRAGRIPVNPDCSLPGHPEVFAIGDMVSLNKLPGVAQPAMQEGKYVGKLIKARLAGEPVEPFKYFDKGTMATIGYRSAVADAFGVKFTGFLAYLMWAFIHVPTWSAGATGSAPSTPGPARSGSGTTARTGSSPSSPPTRNSPRAIPAVRPARPVLPLAMTSAGPAAPPVATEAGPGHRHELRGRGAHPEPGGPDRR